MDDLLPTNGQVALSNATLDRMPDGVQVPTYDRSLLTPGIVHIGLGNFHRAHQAWYLHRLMQAGKAHDWAILGAGVRAYDADMRAKLLAQDCLSTLIELDPNGTAIEVTGPMVDYIPVEAGHGTLIAQMSDARIRIVSLTVTEGGYYLDATTGAFDASHEDIVFDAANPDTPRTAFGAMVKALKQRRDAGHGPFTALSCDNLQGNGAILRQTVVGLAKLSDADLAAWIDSQVSFPNSMVDCIVPATTPDVIRQARKLGILDAAPVTHENFRQWVIEDDFCAGRPAWEDVGATMTDDVHTYEAMKIRMLNGGHQLLANAGEILGVETIAACMQDNHIAGFFQAVMEREVQHHVAAVPGMAPPEYLGLITRRFANPQIHDTTRRVAFDGSSRHTGFLLPTVRDAISNGGALSGLALGEALWARMCAGWRDDGSEIEANDPFWADLMPVARATKEDPKLWLAQDHIYGDIAADKDFAEAFEGWLAMLWSDGTRATLDAYLNA